MKELLPVGSIVSVDDTKNIDIMIVGYYPIDGRTKQCFEYLGVIYPGGTTREKGVKFMFNHADVRKVIFKGYSTDETRKAINALTEHTEKRFAAFADKAPSETEEDLFF